MSVDKDRNADPHPSTAKTPAPNPPRASKNQPGLRPSPQPNDSAPVAIDPHAPVRTTDSPWNEADPVPPRRDPHKELAEAEADLKRIKADVMSADHAIRAAEARVRDLKTETGR